MKESPSSYSLDGDDPENRYVLANRPGAWAVFFYARGREMDRAEFETEDEACSEFRTAQPVHQQSPGRSWQVIDDFRSMPALGPVRSTIKPSSSSAVRATEPSARRTNDGPRQRSQPRRS